MNFLREEQINFLQVTPEEMSFKISFFSSLNETIHVQGSQWFVQGINELNYVILQTRTHFGVKTMESCILTQKLSRWCWDEDQSPLLWATGSWSSVTASVLSQTENLGLEHLSVLHAEEGNLCTSMSWQDLSANEDWEVISLFCSLSHFHLRGNVRRRENTEIMQNPSQKVKQSFPWKIRLPR